MFSLPVTTETPATIAMQELTLRVYFVRECNRYSELELLTFRHLRTSVGLHIHKIFNRSVYLPHLIIWYQTSKAGRWDHEDVFNVSMSVPVVALDNFGEVEYV